jgi:type IV secretory pathway TrbF-like protein
MHTSPAPQGLSITPGEQAARRQYVEQFGSLIVMNTYLKLALLVLSMVALALVYLNIRTYEAFHELKPLVIRISDIGRAEAVRYESLQYHPQEAEIRFFLTQFVELHYSRMRATVRESYARSFYFLDPRLADEILAADKKSKALESFLSGAADDTDVRVKNVSIEDLRQAPYRATVEFEKVYYGPDHTETKRERYVGNIVFTFRDRVPNAVIPVNPLGLVITYFREDQAFQP